MPLGSDCNAQPRRLRSASGCLCRRRPPSLWTLIRSRYLHCLYLPFVAECSQFHNFIILTMMLLFSHDSAIGWEEVLAVALGGSRARRFTRARRVCPGRVHCRRSRSSIPDALCDYPASAKAGGCIGCRVARPLGKAAAFELAWFQGARTSARSVAADGGAEISCVARRRTSRPLAHRARASPRRGDPYRTYSGTD